MTTDDCVLIAGAGPVGTITGLRLAQLGVPVKSFDAELEIPTENRAATVHASTLHLLDELAMAAPMIKRGLEARHFQFRDRVSREIIVEFDFGLLKEDVTYPFALQLEQHKTVEIARDLANKLELYSLHRGHEVITVEQTDDGIAATVRGPDGAEQVHRGRYLIGCDGGRSITRKSQDIDFPGFTWEERFLVGTTDFDFSAVENFRNRNYIAHPERWCALFQVPGDKDQGTWRTLFPTSADETDEEVMSDKWVNARAQECLPDAHSFDFTGRNIYQVHQRVAATFRHGRVLLAGDAAHVNNPLGGMGMNGGIHDGLNIAEKLAKIWHGEAGEELLGLYDRQRRPTAEKYVQAQSIQNKEALQETDEAARQKRFDGMRETANDPAKHLDYVRRASLVTMLNEANAIT